MWSIDLGTAEISFLIIYSLSRFVKKNFLFFWTYCKRGVLLWYFGKNLSFFIWAA
jgi:hypothetical protein